MYWMELLFVQEIQICLRLGHCSLRVGSHIRETEHIKRWNPINKTPEILCCTPPYPPRNLLGNLICFKRQLVNTSLLDGINPSDDHMKATKTKMLKCLHTVARDRGPSQSSFIVFRLRALVLDSREESDSQNCTLYVFEMETFENLYIYLNSA